MSGALAYLIAFSTYGTRLHGDGRGTVDEEHNGFGARFVDPDTFRVRQLRERLVQRPYWLDGPRPEVALKAIRETCQRRQWALTAAHVRSNHLHIVVTSHQTPEKVMNDLKSYASLALNAAGFDSPERHRWTRHGSTVYLFDQDRAADAVGYVGHAQGGPMAAFVAERPYPWEL